VGDTDGYGYGANGKLGWRFGDGSDGASLMSLASATYARTSEWPKPAQIPVPARIEVES